MRALYANNRGETYLKEVPDPEPRGIRRPNRNDHFGARHRLGGRRYRKRAPRRASGKCFWGWERTPHELSVGGPRSGSYAELAVALRAGRPGGWRWAAALRPTQNAPF